MTTLGQRIKTMATGLVKRSKKKRKTTAKKPAAAKKKRARPRKTT